MAIDVGKEKLLSCSQVAKMLPPSPAGKPVNAATIWRWMTHGHRGVKLDGVTLGHVTYTTAAALQRFGAECGKRREPVRLRTARQRKKDAARADRKLDAAGVK